MAHQIDGIVRDLLSEFPGRAQDQGARRCSLEIARIGRILALGLLGWRIGDVCARFVRRRCVGQNAWPMLR